jgi:hypothetical protein
VVALACGGAVAGGVLSGCGAEQSRATAGGGPPTTAAVEKGKLSDMVSVDGTLTRRARSDGSPYVVTNQARGTYTWLPEAGDEVGCGGTLYRVDDRPVLLLCGTVPAYRDLHEGDVGRDVRQLNRNLHRLGYDGRAGVALDPGVTRFTAGTEKALDELHRDKGLAVTGALDLAAAVFLPEPVRIAAVTGVLGGPARPGGQVARGTSDRLVVHVDLDPSQQGEVRKGDRAQITLPGNVSVTGRVDGFGQLATVAAGQGSNAATVTIPTEVGLDHPGKARGLDGAAVAVDITTRGVDDALSVPVTAIVGRSGGGYAVEAVRTGGRRHLVTVRLGLFDTTAGRVQVAGDLHVGDHVVVPSP